MIDNKCKCKQCKVAKRKGLVLGTRRMTYWLVRAGKSPELYSGPVSDYVPYHRYQKGRRPDVEEAY